MTDENRPARRRRMQRHRRMRWFRIISAMTILVVVIVIGRMLMEERGGSAEDGEAGDTVTVLSGDAHTNAAAESGDLLSGQNDADARTEPVTITLSFVGDCTLGTDENFAYSTSLNAYYDSYGADWFFDGVRSVFESDDITVVNMEGTLTEETARADKTYAFKGAPEYVQILSGSSVEAANLANNHSHDYGTQSYTDTIEILEENGISHFGYDDIALVEAQGVTVGLVGIYELAEGLGVSQQVTEKIQTAREMGADLVVVSFHWGNEKESCPESTQVTLAHQAIDDGADLVIGHHPHVLQGIEYYNGKVIAYSLGNFCFGGNKNPSDKDTIILQMSFTVDSASLDAQSADASENAQVLSSELNIIPCRLSSATDYNDYQPTILDGDEAQAVLDKLQERSMEIASNYAVQAVYSSAE